MSKPRENGNGNCFLKLGYKYYESDELRGPVHSEQGRIVSNTLYVQNTHLTKGQAYSYETNPSSRQRGCYIRAMTVTVH
jgi:hypothetical protein